MPHIPQCAVELERSVSQPFDEDPSQFPQPESHEVSVHVPVEHDSLACESEQDVPHIPQFELLRRSLSQPLKELPSQL
jgi:hypothetical protein